jgi:ABC-type nickel/cobalt efflux system permease component RcnA
MDKVFKIFSFGVAGIFVFALWAGIWFGLTALMAWAFQALFNYIAVNTNHASSQITYWVSFAIVVLLSLIGSFFRGSNSSKSDN